MKFTFALWYIKLYQEDLYYQTSKRIARDRESIKSWNDIKIN